MNLIENLQLIGVFGMSIKHMHDKKSVYISFVAKRSIIKILFHESFLNEL